MRYWRFALNTLLNFSLDNPNFEMMNLFLPGKELVEYRHSSGQSFKRVSLRMTTKNRTRFEEAWKGG